MNAYRHVESRPTSLSVLGGVAGAVEPAAPVSPAPAAPTPSFPLFCSGGRKDSRAHAARQHAQHRQRTYPVPLVALTERSFA